MKVHVICCDDGVKYAVVDDEDKAKKKMEELKAKNQAAFLTLYGYTPDPYVSYWHIHTVEGE